jgi:hypothetical protein
MIVYHGTTIERLSSIQAEGLWPRSFVAASRALASQYAWLQAMSHGAEGCVVIELDVPRAAVLDAQSWWWAEGQLQLPFGCPASCIVSVDDSDPQQF